MKFSIERLYYAIDQVKNDAATQQKAAELGIRFRNESSIDNKVEVIKSWMNN